jgi:1,4-dihydroxy-2-naphthoate octaprenyltransferase
VACVYSVLIGAALALNHNGGFSGFPVLMFVLALFAAFLFQSTANAFNDYYDFIGGNDRADNSDNPGDAILAYNNINPEHVKKLGFCFMVAAILLGIYPVYKGGPIVLLIGLIGCTLILTYSGGKKSVSHTAFGETAAFFGDGLEVPATFLALVGASLPDMWGGLWPEILIGKIFFCAIPVAISPAMITMVNNICAIERDTVAGRRGVVILLGRPRARIFFLTWICIWLVMIVTCVALFFPKGLILVLALIAASSLVWLRLFRLSYVPEKRGQCIGVIVTTMHCLGISYVAAVVMHALRG